MQITPVLYGILKCSVLVGILLLVIYVILNSVMYFSGVNLTNLLGKFYIKKRYAVVFIIVLILLNAIVNGMYDGQFDYPSDVKVESIVGRWVKKDSVLDISNDGSLYFNEANSIKNETFDYELVGSVIFVQNKDKQRTPKWKIIIFRDNYRIIDYSDFEIYREIDDSHINSLGYERSV